MPRDRSASFLTRFFGESVIEGTSPTWLVGLTFLEKDPSGHSDAMKDLCWEKLMTKSRFRSKLAMNRFGGRFEEIPQPKLRAMYDDGYLWSEVFEDGSGTREDLNRLILDTAKRNFDKNKPLWRLQYARKLADGSACLILTVNHAIGDGVSMIESLMELCDKHDDVADNEQQAAGPPGKRQDKSASKQAERDTWRNAVSRAVQKKVPDYPSALKLTSAPSTSKAIAETEEAIPLQELKEIKSRFEGATINDILMAVLTMAIRAYLVEVGDVRGASGAERMRCSFPINLRARNEPVLRNGNPHNKVAYGTFNFDFKYQTRTELVWKVKRQIDEIKQKKDPIVQYLLLKTLMKLMTRRRVLGITRKSFNHTTAQLSNVVGPQSPISLAGERVTQLKFFLIAPVGIYFGILSYAGFVNVGVNMDAGIGADPVQLIKHFKQELDALKAELAKVEGMVPPPPSGTA